MVQEMYSRSILKLARTRGGLTQDQVARLAGTSQAAISAIESGKTSPTVETLVRLIGACGLELRSSLATPDTHDVSRLAFQRTLDPSHIAEHEQRQQQRLEQIKRDRKNQQRRDRRAKTESHSSIERHGDSSTP